MNNNTLTTTNIGKEELKHLRKLAAHHGLKQSEFINSAISFFRSTGINPSLPIFSPKEEIAMLTKRVNEIIRFMQVHEKQKLSPLMERLILLEKKLSEHSSKGSISTGDLDELMVMISNNKNSIEGQLNRIINGINKFSENVNASMNAQYELQKKTTLLIGLLYECLKHRGMGGMREEDKKAFEDALY